MAKALSPRVPKSFTKALDQIKSKGFSHIKVELEAKLGRSGESISCATCSQQGWIACHECHNSGYKIVDNEPVECLACGGDGQSECRRCNGRGYTHGGWSDHWCRDFILQHIKAETARNIVFGEFYWDGSVDSEYTFTMPIEYAGMVPDVIASFNKLGTKIGNGIDIDNAGLHIAVLPSGKYPCDGGLLNKSFMKNFRTEVSKLLPALYFLGTHTSETRGLSYRKPFVSDSEKYSAIYTHDDTAIEYRVFDPCFDKPEAFFDKVEVIAQTLKYYSQDTVKPRFEKFNMYNLSEISELYGSSENYDALLKTVSHLKPNKSFSKLKNERGLMINKTILADIFRKYKKSAKADIQRTYLEQARRWDNHVTSAMQWILINYFRRPIRDRDLTIRAAIEASQHTESEYFGSESLLRDFVRANLNLFNIAPPPSPPSRETFREYMPNQGYPDYILKPGDPLDEESSEYE